MEDQSKSNTGTLNPLDFESFSESVGELTRLHKTLMSDFSPEGSFGHLNATQGRTLCFIGRHGATCMKGLYNHVGLEAGSFTSVADYLMDEGLVERVKDPGDRRRTLLTLTDDGERVVRALNKEIQKHITRRVEVLPPELRQRFAEALAVLREVNQTIEGNQINE